MIVKYGKITVKMRLRLSRLGKNLKKGPVFKSPKFPTFSGNLENSTESRKNLVIWLKYTFVNNVQAGTYRHLKLEIKAALAQYL